jgi:hypothetical protein
VSEGEAAAFVRSVREIAREDEPEDALDLVYQTIDRWMRQGRFDIVREVLALADPDPLPLVVALAYVSVTQPASELLGEERARFVARVEERERAG